MKVKINVKINQKVTFMVSSTKADIQAFSHTYSS